MTIIAAPSANQVEGTLAASYTRGTDTTITLVDGTLFPSPTPLGHVISIRDTEKVTATTKWCLIIYTSKETHVLTMGGGAADYALAKMSHSETRHTSGRLDLLSICLLLLMRSISYSL